MWLISWKSLFNHPIDFDTLPHRFCSAPVLCQVRQMKKTTISDSHPRLSVTMIVRNEESVLGASIESVRAIADEIIILDTGSTDKTSAVAWKLGATVVNAHWSHNFSEARNRAIDLLTGDWALWLDAGERLSAEDAKLLRAFVNQKADPGKVYRLAVEVPSLGAEIGGEEISAPRLMPLKSGLRFSGRIRETLHPALETQGLKLDFAPGRILRHPRQHDQAWKTLKADRNLTLAAMESAECSSPSPRLLLTEGDAYCNLGMFDQARHAFLAALKAASQASSEMLEAYYGLLTCYACDPFLRHHQLNVCVEALDVFPIDTQLLLALGKYLYSSNHIDTAIRAFDTAVRYGQVNPEVWHLCEINKVAELCLNAVLGLRDGAKPTPTPPPEIMPSTDSLGRLLRIDKEGRPQQAGTLHIPVGNDAVSSHAFF
jgi:glycosyltransferase involved in cell wall biosynthesis